MKKNFLLTIKSIPTMALIFLLLSFLSSTKVQAQITISPWKMNLDGPPQQVPPPALLFHGAPRGYVYMNIPAINDANWVNAPLDGSGKVAFSVPSQLGGSFGCLSSIDFTFFQTSVNIPALTAINTFTVSFTQVDDGARIYIFNSAHPTGAFVPGADLIFQGPPVTANLASLAVAGEVNRIVVAQYDDCAVGNNLIGVQIIVNGTPIPVVATINCPSNITVDNTPGLCSAIVSYPPATADGNPTPTISYSQASGTSFPVGTTTVTATATNATSTARCSFNVTVIDAEKPMANCKNATVTLVNGSASISAADINNNSTDNCGIKSMSVLPNTFSCSDIGANNVILTVTDVHGNIQTCTAIVTVIGTIPSCSISAIPSNNTYTGGVPTNIYIGYGPQSVTLSVNATGGSPFTYEWAPGTGLNCTNCAAPVFTPTAAGTYTFTVNVTNNFGCRTTCRITICVLDIRDGNDGKKVFVCHVPPGNPGNPQTISISVNAVPAHIPGHTLDHLGKCGESPCGTNERVAFSANAKETESNDMLTGELKISVSPNPSNGQFTVRLNNLQSSKAEVTILNANGSIIEKRNVQNNMKGNTIQFNLRTKASGILLIKVVSKDGVSTERIVIQR